MVKTEPLIEVVSSIPPRSGRRPSREDVTRWLSRVPPPPEVLKITLSSPKEARLAQQVIWYRKRKGYRDTKIALAARGNLLFIRQEE